MKILFDHEVFSYQEHGGIVRYFSELIKGIRKIPGFSCRTGAFFSNNQYLPHEFSPYPFGNLLQSKQLFFRLNSLFFSSSLIFHEYDLVHFTFYPDPQWRKRIHKPIVITVHDMTPELFPELFPDAGKWVQNKKFWCHHADMIITVSDHTGKDLLNIYPQVDPSKVHRVYLASSLSEASVFPAMLPGKYILYAGGRNSYKNFPVLIESMKEIPEIHLVCTGTPFSEEEKSLLKQYGVTDRVHQFKLTDAELAGAYKHAEALVYPSLYEGFGLPVLEAFSAGIPAILSNRSCFPEIAGDAACFFDPADKNSIVHAIQRVLSDPEYRDSLVGRGTRRLAQFSWERTAAETQELYSRLIQNQNSSQKEK